MTLLVDTHTHIYLEQFDNDKADVMARAFDKGVQKLFLPNIDTSTISRVWETVGNYPEHCFPMMGLHPSSVNADWKNEMAEIEQEIRQKKIYALGEIGLDFYWSEEFKTQQIEAFKYQVNLAKELSLPIVIHCRNSFNELVEILQSEKDEKLSGIFHCFTGSVRDANQVIELGFYLGIGGILTFKNAGLDKTMKEISLDQIVLETDAPYLAPIPNRGKRNESSYLFYVAKKLGEIKNMELGEIAETTTKNSHKVFGKF